MYVCMCVLGGGGGGEGVCRAEVVPDLRLNRSSEVRQTARWDIVNI